MTLVSVLLPVRNGMPYLNESIESVLTQTFSDFELLVIDDGSTDDTWMTLQKLASIDNRICIIQQRAEGARRALNRGIEISCGEFLARMDADDIAEPDRLRLQVEFLNKHPEVVAVGGQNRAIDPDGDILFEIHYPTTSQDIATTLWSGRNCLSHPTMMMRKSAVVKAGGYTEEYPTDDYGLWLRLSELGNLANLPEFLLRYRVHPLVSSIAKHVQQSRNGEEVLKAACKRRGLLFPKKFEDATTNAPKTVPRIHHHWAMSAVRDGYWRSARKHSLYALRHEPFNLHFWWTLFKSISRMQMQPSRLTKRIREIIERKNNAPC